jgi:hypothetical protein
VVKKRAAKKSGAKKSAAKRRKPSGARKKPTAQADRSRLDLAPLQQHIRKRIDDLRKKGAPPMVTTAARSGESPEETIVRLENALETLQDICFPTMDIPI